MVRQRVSVKPSGKESDRQARQPCGPQRVAISEQAPKCVTREPTRP